VGAHRWAPALGELCAGHGLRCKPPAGAQEELDATLEAAGLAPVVHQAPFYGDAADVPERPPVWAGLEFRVPSAAAGHLPPFRPGAPRPPPRRPGGPAGAAAAAPRALALCPAARPPTRAETDAWLDAQSGAAPAGGGGAAGSGGASGAGFRMDPNTGRLIPGHAAGGGGGGDGGTQGSPGVSLLETPPLGSARSAGRRAAPPTAPSRLRFATQPAAPGAALAATQADEPVRRCAAPLHREQSRVRSSCLWPLCAPHLMTVSKPLLLALWARLDLETLGTALCCCLVARAHVRARVLQGGACRAPPLSARGGAQAFKPPSPKYDERSFFHDAPHHPYAAGAMAGTPWATPLRAGPPAGSGSPASGVIGPRDRAPEASAGSDSAHAGGGGVASAPVLRALASAASSHADETRGEAAAAAQPQARAAAAARAPAPQGAGAEEAAPAARAAPRARGASQITPPSAAPGSGGATPVSQAGFRRVVPGKGQGMTLLSVEVHAESRCAAPAAGAGAPALPSGVLMSGAHGSPNNSCLMQREREHTEA